MRYLENNNSNNKTIAVNKQIKIKHASIKEQKQKHKAKINSQEASTFYKVLVESDSDKFY